MFPVDGVVLDLETTGLTPSEEARVIEIGAVRIRGGVLADQFQTLVNPGVAIPEITTRITGISRHTIADAPRSSEAIPRLLKFIGKGPVIAHNADFERDFLAAECQAVELLPPKLHFYCSLKLARGKIQGAPDYRLETLAGFLALGAEGDFHRALKDALITAQLWLHLHHVLEDGREQARSRWQDWIDGRQTRPDR